MELLALLTVAPAFAELPTLLDASTRTQLVAALDGLNMTVADLAFAKDIGEPKLALAWTRKALRDPLIVPERANEIARALAANDWTALPRWLETGPAPTNFPAPAADPLPFQELPRPLPDALAAFVAESIAARAELDDAFRSLPLADRHYLAASLLSESFPFGAGGTAQDALIRAGFTVPELARVAAENDALDPRPSASNRVALIGAVDRARLLHAGQRFVTAVSSVARAASSAASWPAAPRAIETAAGLIRIGTPGRDLYEGPALLIIDPAGDDRYRDGPGAALGLPAPALAAIIDFGGDDEYRSSDFIGAAGALFGAAVVIDTQGDDTYRAACAGQAAGLLGVAMLMDGAGDDRYRGGSLAQGAGLLGAGWLLDRAGRDVYEVDSQGQAFAGVFGAGLLADLGGVDRYLAGGGAADTDRHNDRFLSLAQGFSIGHRPFWGGGIAALYDADGNDTYVADVYGQGVAYWYAGGFLLDGGGHDHYTVYQYGQGAGIHLAVGLLADADGDDVYTGGTLVQGAAHDYAVGFLFDRAGNDAYLAEASSQARAMNNGLAVLADTGGDDVYTARDNESCQGIGNEGGHRDYGALGLLLDGGGRDRYSCGAIDGSPLQRPFYGIIHDTEGAR